MTFDNVFKSIVKKTDKDPFSSALKAGDTRIKSRVPFGVLTDIPELDLAIARDGWPAGRVIEVFGLPMSGKSSIALHAISNIQKMGGGAVYIDTEKTWDEDRAKELGVDVHTNFVIIDTDSLESGFRSAQATIDSIKAEKFNKPMIVVIDSVTGAANERMKETELGIEERLGEDARKIRGGLRRLVEGVAESHIILFLINHSISKMAAGPYQKQTQAAGGHAIKFFSTLRFEMTNAGWIKDPNDSERRIGQKVKISIEKIKGSKMWTPKVEANLMFDGGFDTAESLLEAGQKTGFIERVNMRTYKLGEVEFPKADWPITIENLGGLDTVYKAWISDSIEKGVIKPWAKVGVTVD